MKIGIKIQGNKAILKKVPEKVREFLEDEIAATTSDIADDARAKVRVDTGILKGSIVDTATGLNGEVNVGAKYAPYVEFGTGGLVNVPAGVEDYAIKFKGKGIKQVNLPPRPFLFPSFFDNINKMSERIKEEIESK